MPSQEEDKRRRSCLHSLRVPGPYRRAARGTSPVSRGRIGQAFSLSRCLSIRVPSCMSPKTLSQFSMPPLKGREAERRKARTRKPHQRMRPPPPNLPRLRLRKTRRGLASRRSTAALATPIKAMAQSRPCFLGRAAAGVTCRSAVPVQRGTPRTGHNAGRSDARTAREQGYEPCPQEPHPPPSIGRHRLTSLRGTDQMKVSIAVTDVKGSSPSK